MQRHPIRRSVRRAASAFSLLLSPIVTVAAATALLGATRVGATNAGGGGGARERVSDLGDWIKGAVLREGRKDQDAEEVRRANRPFTEEVEAWERGDHDEFVGSLDDAQRREYFAPVLAMLAEDAELDDEKYTPPPAIGLAVELETGRKGRIEK